MNGKAQAGLEYLVTYGWALVLIATVIGALVFIVTSPVQNEVFVSSDSGRILVKGGSVEGTISTILLQNITGGEIKITSLSGWGLGCEINDENPFGVKISAGGEILIVCTGVTEQDKETPVSVGYTDQLGLERTVEIESQTTTPKSLECSPECEECQTCEEGICIAKLNGTACGSTCYHCQDGTCVPATVNYADATALGCNIESDQECRKCTAGVCGFYTSQQHNCRPLFECTAGGYCK